MFEKGISFAGDFLQGDRKNQQDYFGFVPPEDLGDPGSLLLVVADGMGGYAGGEVASREAVETFVDVFFEEEQLDDRRRLLEALHHANDRIAFLSAKSPELKDMGTTFVGILIRDMTLRWVSVGDSPFFLFREGALVRLNAEHSMRQVLSDRVEVGDISPEEASQHPARNHLLSVINGQDIEMIDAPVDTLSLQPDDLLLACSDGVLSLDPKRLVRTLEIGRDDDARSLVKRLLRDVEGRRKDHQDNTTVAVIRIPMQEGASTSGTKTEAAAAETSGSDIAVLSPPPDQEETEASASDGSSGSEVQADGPLEVPATSAKP